MDGWSLDVDATHNGTTNQNQYSQSGQRLAALRVPQFDRLLVVLAAGHNKRFLRMPVHALNVGTVAAQHFFLLAAQKVEDAQRAIVAAADELVVGRTETVVGCLCGVAGDVLLQLSCS